MPTPTATLIRGNVEGVQARIARAAARTGRSAAAVTLMAVTKGVGLLSIREAYAAGVRCFGENYLQEAKAKLPALEDIRKETSWHMIGSLQHGRIGGALELFDALQGVSSVRIAGLVSKRAQSPCPIFLEVNVAEEPTKHGLSPAEVPEAVEAIRAMPNLDLRGLMTIAPAAADPEAVRPVFRRLRQMASHVGLRELSMGMTGDFEVAVEEGATLVRIGTGIFGPRDRTA